MNEQDKFFHRIYKITIFAFALVIILAIAAVCKSFSSEIFTLMSPAFNAIIGAFVVLLGSISMSKPKRKSNKAEEDKKEK